MSQRPLSWSSMTTYESCPHRWRLRYVENAPAEAPPPRSMALGSALHSAFEAYYSHARRGGGGNVRAARQALAQAAGALPEDAQQEAHAVLASWASRATRRTPRVLAVERAFRVQLPNGVPFVGVIDRIDEAPGGRVSVTDYKSGPSPPAYWLARRSPQLGYYQIGAQAGLGLHVDHLAVEHVRSGLRFTSPPRARPEIEALIDRAGRAWDGIRSGDFPARLGRDCPCEFARRCPYFSDLFPKIEDWSGAERARVAAAVEAYATTRDASARAAIEEHMRVAGVLRAWGAMHVVERDAGGALRVRERPDAPGWAPASGGDAGARA